MSVFYVFPVALALVLSTAVVAQESPVPNPAPAGAASMPHDCAKPMARHDHGAEKGTPTPMSAACPMASAAPVEKAKAKRGHDHARVHKLM
jgi:hypothetical protein